jgi:eukaryotic-like serine/threonine-protein kinase
MSTALISPDWVGRVVDGRFALLEWLGGSGYSGVFKTELQQPIPKPATIKLIPAEGAEADGLLANWAKTTLLSHPHLIKIFRSGRFQFGTVGMVYVVTEYADEVLSQIVPVRPLTATEAREMVGPILDGLSFLHEKGLVHGHVKPSNILVVSDQLKLSADQLRVGGAKVTQFKQLSIYDPPEGFEEAMSPATDAWGLGVTLVEALTQTPPAWNRSAFGEPTVPESVPQPFRDIARDCLRTNPARRCTLEEVRARLAPGRKLEFPVSRVSEPEDEEPRKRSVLPWVIAGIVAVLALVGLLMWHGPKGSPQPADQAAQSPAAPEAPVVAPAPTPQPAPSRGTNAKGGVATKMMPDVASYATETIRGTVVVVVRAAVDARGQVTNATFKSAGPSRYFADRALIAARGWKFKPAVRHGQPVESIWAIRFGFRRGGTETSATEEMP